MRELFKILHSGFSDVCFVRHATLKPIEDIYTYIYLTLVKLVLPALALDPGGQVGVGLVAGRDESVAELGPVSAQVGDLLLPGGIVAVPNEPLLLEDRGTLRGHGRRLAVIHELVLAALALHPAGELRIGGEGVRDEAVAVRLAELEHLRQHVIPPVLVELLESGVGALALARFLDVAVPSGGNVDGGRGDGLGDGIVHAKRGHFGVISAAGRLLAAGTRAAAAAGGLGRRRGTRTRSRGRRSCVRISCTITLLSDAGDADEVRENVRRLEVVQGLVLALNVEEVKSEGECAVCDSICAVP